jgi:hypothetical protein
MGEREDEDEEKGSDGEEDEEEEERSEAEEDEERSSTSTSTSTRTGAAEKGPPHPVMGTLDLMVGALVLIGVWLGLPARWWPMDVAGTVIGLAMTASGVGLLLRLPWGETVGRIVGAVTLVAGLALFTALAFTASYIAGLYGPIGGGGAILLFAATLLLVPYLVVFPAAQLWFLARKDR